MTPNFVHATNTQVGTGHLSDKGLVVLLNGRPLAKDGKTSITIGQAYQISINSTSGDAFRGFLIRLDGNGVFTDIALNPTDSDDDLTQVASLCVETYLVGGLTHTSNADKTTVVGSLQMEEAAAEMTLDVTVVVRNSESADVSEWYFSSYAMDAIESTSVVVGTAAPVTATPTDSVGTNNKNLTAGAPVDGSITTLSPATGAPETMPPASSIPQGSGRRKALSTGAIAGIVVGVGLVVLLGVIVAKRMKK